MRISHGMLATLLLTLGSTAPAQTVLSLPGLAGTKLDPRTAVRADLIELVPTAGDGRATRFELDTDGSIAPENAALQLVQVPAASRYVVQVPFKVAVPGLERIEFDCALVEFSLSVPPASSGPARLVGRAWYGAAVSGPAAGTVRLGLVHTRTPAEEQAAVAEAARALARRLTGAGQPQSEQSAPAPMTIALCEMTASGQWQGTRWHSVTDPLQNFATRERSDSVMLLDLGHGQRWASQPFVTSPLVSVGAIRPAPQE